MQVYKEIDSTTFRQQHFHFLLVEEQDHVLTVTLNRPNKKNALHPQMVNEIAYAFQYAHSNSDIWMLVVEAVGNVFCAGADLKAMAGMAEEHESTIPDSEDAILIGEIFRKVNKPVIAKVTGDVYAGGFFFLAGSHIVVAQNNIKFGLPEVKRGLYPFQVMASLLQVMPARKVVDWCIRGYNLPVAEAERFGLVTQVVEAEDMEQTIQSIINELKQNSPTAVSNGLQAFDHIRPSGKEHEYLLDMLMQTIGSNDGQEGLKAFREKRTPVWGRENS